MHYREIILNDEVYSEIASRITLDMTYIDNIRVSRYGKKSDENCFKEPCNYLGKLSGQLLLPIDYNNYGSIGNFWKTYYNDLLFRHEEAEKKTKENNRKDNKPTLSNGAPVSNYVSDDEDIFRYYNGPLYVDILNKMIPSVRDGYELLCQTTREQLKDFRKKY